MQRFKTTKVFSSQLKEENYIPFLLNSPRIRETPQNFDHHLCVLKIFTDVDMKNLKALHLQSSPYKTGGLRCTDSPAALLIYTALSDRFELVTKQKLPWKAQEPFQLPWKHKWLRADRYCIAERCCIIALKSLFKNCTTEMRIILRSWGVISCGIHNYTAAEDFCKHRSKE